MDLAGEWVTRGWWKVRPGEAFQTDAKTRNRNIYFFAKPARPELGLGTWNGEGQNDSIRGSIAHGKFHQMRAEPFSYEGMAEATFFKRDIGEGWKVYVQPFLCK
jgi:uncharacterized membrane protein